MKRYLINRSNGAESNGQIGSVREKGSTKELPMRKQRKERQVYRESLCSL